MVLGDTRLFTAPFPFLYCRSMAFGDIFGFFFISTANDSRTGRPKKKGQPGVSLFRCSRWIALVLFIF